ncbi:hypothetical protein H310_08839 [Aphanomyces invadans]|uniref:DNA ligase 1 n=1 Tax=Aphanomyces invadans TaxID=157072 RepID=A0A024TVS4_9STRA|nr:hypothetical protein H310_08839 [Aphanomyces invadans]ETV98094.1 hypothetical protein H310_08839 [Aphanomyces invadans]|eukprot:XP_008872969.1 hypothetical protein H310_08839 [Aphanomyces invadans]
MLFRDLAAVFRRIQLKNSRDASISELSNAFRAIRDNTPTQLPKAMYLVTSQLAPSHQGVELRFRDKAFAPVVQTAFASANADIPTIFDAYQKSGDYGTAVEDLLKQSILTLPTASAFDNSASPMTIDVVYDQLCELATQVGKGSTQRKQDIAAALLARASTVDEATFLTRLLAHQNLRIGIGEKSVVTALAHSFADSETDKPLLQPWLSSVTTAYSQRPIFEDLIETLIQPQVLALPSLADKAAFIQDHAVPKPGTPVQTMLGYPVSSLHQIPQRMRKYRGGAAACEFKYDGARLQIHMTSVSQAAQDDAPSRSLSIFSRNLERIPEDHKYFLNVAAHVVPFVNSHVESLIIEGEMVAVQDAVESGDTPHLLPFQMLQTNSNSTMCLFAFDCLYLNGTSLLHRPFHERRAALHTAFSPPLQRQRQGPHSPTRFQFVQSQDVVFSSDEASDEDGTNGSDGNQLVLRAVLQAAIDADCEGLMVKALDEPYKPGCRTHTWLKVKRDYLPATPAMASGMFLPDSLDLVPIAAFRGKGRRADVFGSFLLACYDPTNDVFRTVGKVGSGFTDVGLADISTRLLDTVVAAKPPQYIASDMKSIQPDVWFAPSEVWEIRAAQLTKSTKYTAGQTLFLSKPSANKSGLGLRFPRFLAVRHDKCVAQATTDDQLAALYQDSASTTASNEQPIDTIDISSV